MKKKTLYHKIQFYKYKDGEFGAGLVKHSNHPINKVYLQIKDYIYELRTDEAYAILGGLGNALWSANILTLKQKNRLKWITEKELRK